MDRSLSEFVKTNRRAMNLTQQELGELAGLSGRNAQKAISDIERNVTKWPAADFRRALATALGVRHIDLLVAAGELRTDEVPVEGAVREPFRSGDPRRDLLEAMERIEDPNQAESREVLKAFARTLNAMLDGE